MMKDEMPENESKCWVGRADPRTVWRVCHAISGYCKRCPTTGVHDDEEGFTRGCYLQAVECVNIVETGNPWRKSDGVKAPWTVLTHTPDELDTLRVNEAWRRAGNYAKPLDVMFDVARLAREGWMPPDWPTGRPDADTSARQPSPRDEP